MVDVCALKGEIVKAGYTQKQVYEDIGLTKRQWEFRCNNKTFDSNDIYNLISILKLSNPMSIFFVNEVT